MRKACLLWALLWWCHIPFSKHSQYKPPAATSPSRNPASAYPYRPAELQYQHREHCSYVCFLYPGFRSNRNSESNPWSVGCFPQSGWIRWPHRSPLEAENHKGGLWSCSRFARSWTFWREASLELESVWVFLSVRPSDPNSPKIFWVGLRL